MKISQLPRFPVTIADETARIGTAGELVVALDVLNGRQDREVLEQLRPHLCDILSAPGDFAKVMSAVQPENQLFLIDAMGNCLAKSLLDARRLRDLLAMLASSDVKQRLIETLGSVGLRSLIVTASELASVLSWTYGTGGQRVLDLIGHEHLRRLIRHGEDLSLVLSALAEPAQMALLEKFGLAAAAELVVDGRDLALILRALPRDAAAALLECYTRSELISAIGNKVYWAHLIERIEPEEAAKLLEKLGAKERAL